MCCHAMNRREFLATSAAGLGLLTANSAFAGENPQWLPDKPFIRYGRALRVQPVLLYSLYQPRPTTSWRPWGGLHTENDVDEEAGRISGELEALRAKADFPISILPLRRVRSKEQAMQARDSKEYDVMLVYAASGDGECWRPVFQRIGAICFLCGIAPGRFISGMKPSTAGFCARAAKISKWTAIVIRPA